MGEVEGLAAALARASWGKFRAIRGDRPQAKPRTRTCRSALSKDKQKALLRGLRYFFSGQVLQTFKLA
jgi:hypothetical protein